MCKCKCVYICANLRHESTVDSYKSPITYSDPKLGPLNAQSSSEGDGWWAGW